MNINMLTMTNNIMNINSKVIIPSSYINESQIKDLQNLNVNGKISFDNENINLDLNLSGKMILIDSFSLEEIEYPLDIDIMEILDQDDQKMLKNKENNENILDITPILWQNIVLEVPISYSKDKKLSKISGEGWELVRETKETQDPRLAKLNLLLDEDERSEIDGSTF